MDGICTLGNDRVYDQIVALINSIEIFAGPKMPVCIYPYDDRVERLRELVRSRPNINLYDDIASIQRWDAWVEQVWTTHPTARQQRLDHLRACAMVRTWTYLTATCSCTTAISMPLRPVRRWRAN